MASSFSIFLVLNSEIFIFFDFFFSMERTEEGEQGFLQKLSEKDGRHEDCGWRWWVVKLTTDDIDVYYK